MLLGEPPRTPYDIQFGLVGFPIRITPFFWLAAVLLGWNATRGEPRALLAWVLAVFASILIHELGHALAFRNFGTSSHVVLYHFGGLAVPDGYLPSSRDPYRQMAISFAGPAVQMVGALLVMFAVAASGHRIPLIGFVGNLLPVVDAPELPANALGLFIECFLYVSVYWALLNLLPIYPLDGGQIARELFAIFSGTDGIKNSLLLSVFTGAAVALFALAIGRTYLLILFGMLAFSNYQTLQAYSGRGGGFGRRW